MDENIIAPAVYVIKIIEGILNKFVIAVIILLIGLILGRVLGKIVQKFLHELNVNKFFKQTMGISSSIEDFAGYGVKYFIYFIFVIMALNQLGLTSPVLDMISGAIFILIIISIFLGIKDFIPNFIAGISIYKRKFIKEGDKIKIKDMEGEIVKIDLVETRIKTKKGDVISIPNLILTKNELTKKK